MWDRRGEGLGSNHLIVVNLDNFYAGARNLVIINQPETYPAGTYATQHNQYPSQPGQNSNFATTAVIVSDAHYPRAETVVTATPIEATAYINKKNTDEVPPPSNQV